MPSVWKVVRSAMPVTYARQGDRQEEQEADRVATEEGIALHGHGCERPEHKGDGHRTERGEERIDERFRDRRILDRLTEPSAA